MSDEIKVCKSCQRALDVSEFGAKQSRCKSCLAQARNAAKAALATAPAAAEAPVPAEASQLELELDLPRVEAVVPARKLDARTEAKSVDPDAKEADTSVRAEALRKECEEHGVVVGDLLSRAYARRGSIRCRLCENARSSAQKKSKSTAI